MFTVVCCIHFIEPSNNKLRMIRTGNASETLTPKTGNREPQQNYTLPSFMTEISSALRNLLLLHFRALINIIMISITLQLKKFRQTQQEGYKLASQSVKQVDMSCVPDKIYCCADLPQSCAGWSHDYTG